MKILFVVNEVPFPPDNGVRIVSHHAMRLMHEAGHDLALAVLTAEDDTKLQDRFQKISNLCKKNSSWWMCLPARSPYVIQFMSVMKNNPFFVERYRCQIFKRKLKQLIVDFKPDVIHFDIITLAQYRDVVPAGVGTIASINDSNALTLENAFMNAKYRGLELIYRKIQLWQVRRYEATVYSKFDAVHVMSEVDATYLKKLNSVIHTQVIANGTDPSLSEIAEITSKQTDIIFVAKLVGSNIENLTKFLDFSWPVIHSECPGVVLHIVGKSGAEATELQSKVAKHANIKFCGYVDNLSEAYQHCGIAIVPINKDCGIINKAIEAMAAGLAVVGFHKSFAGIKGAKANEHYVSAEDFQGIGKAVVQLIQNKILRESIQHAAHRLVKESYSWSTRGYDYEKMYIEASDHAKIK